MRRRKEDIETLGQIEGAKADGGEEMDEMERIELRPMDEDEMFVMLAAYMQYERRRGALTMGGLFRMLSEWMIWDKDDIKVLFRTKRGRAVLQSRGYDWLSGVLGKETFQEVRVSTLVRSYGHAWQSRKVRHWWTKDTSQPSLPSSLSSLGTVLA